MPIFQELLNLDKEIEQSSFEGLAFINDWSNDTEEQRKQIFEQLTTQYMQGDKVSMLPSCDCGAFREGVGLICPYCNTIVKNNIEKEIQTMVWFRRPPEIDALMSPIIFTMLRERFTKQGWDIIAWFTDQSYSPNVKDQGFMRKLRDRGFERGWNAFYRQFDDIMAYLFSVNELNSSVKSGEVDYLLYLIKQRRESVFCNYIPLPNKALFVFENTNTGIYRNDSTGKAMSYISLMISIEKSIQPLSKRVKENRVAKLYQRISDYQIEHIKTELSPKNAQIRRNTIATKNALAYRSVITSVTEPWDYNAIKVPWTVGVTMFRLHLVNKLMRYGFSHNKAIEHLLSHTGHYDKLLDRFLNELKEEAPEGKIWTTIQRNPSLKQGSMQLVYIGEFKKDPGDKTTGMPLPIVRAPNAKKVGLLRRNAKSTLV